MKRSRNTRIAAFCMAIVLCVMSLVTCLSADTIDKALDTAFGSVLKVILKLVTYVGVALLVWGIVQYFMAMRNEDAENKHKATLVIVAGIGLALIGIIIPAIISTALPSSNINLS